MAQTKSKNFSFHIGKHRLVGTNNDEGRKAFFESKDLGFAEGYAVLFGQSPDFADKNITQTEGGTAYFNKRITSLLKRDQFTKGKSRMLRSKSSSSHSQHYQLCSQMYAAASMISQPHRLGRPTHLIVSIRSYIY